MKNKTKIAIANRKAEIIEALMSTNPSSERLAKLREASMPLIKLLSEEYHPHHTAIVTSTSIELLEGVASEPNIYDFLVD